MRKRYTSSSSISSRGTFYANSASTASSKLARKRKRLKAKTHNLWRKVKTVRIKKSRNIIPKTVERNSLLGLDLNSFKSLAQQANRIFSLLSASQRIR